MPLNPDAVGTVTEAQPITWTRKDALLYALGIGAGTDELAYTTDNTKNVPQQVFPTFTVALDAIFKGLPEIGTFDPAMIVHGQQAITLHQPLAPKGSGSAALRVVAIQDKGKAAVAVIETTALADDGSPLFTNVSSLFIRGAGGFGGDRGGATADLSPPDRAADHEVAYRTSPDQALIYRLSGDRNPLHSDPAFAARVGFDRPILHGLCTYGFTGRALLHSLCDGEAARFRHIEGRFASPVFPGEVLTVRAWRTGDGEARFTTSVDDRVVLDNGLVRFT